MVLQSVSSMGIGPGRPPCEREEPALERGPGGLLSAGSSPPGREGQAELRRLFRPEFIPQGVEGKPLLTWPWSAADMFCPLN